MRVFPIAAACSLISGALLCLACGKKPSEDEIVIRADDYEDMAVSDSQRQSFADTAGLSIPETESDTAATADLPPDSAFVDSSSADSAVTDSVDLPGPSPAGWRPMALEIRGSLYASLNRRLQTDSLPPQVGAEVLGAHCSRCMWWDIRPWEDLIAGDSLYIVYADSAGGDFENRVVALRYVPVDGSGNGSFSVYRYLRAGDSYPSYWYPDGREAPALLDAMPLSTFEEITGIFGEPRSGHAHQGVDFKAPVGTPVRSTIGGTVSRTDWNTDYNGHCVEVDIGGGYSQVFIHLDRLAEGIRPGAAVTPGGLVGYVGNTGRSYAPHLHYQINDLTSGYPVDPYIFHGYHRRRLTDGDMEGFAALTERCGRIMENGG